MMQMRRELRHLVIDEDPPQASLDLRSEPIRPAERAGPQRSPNQRRDEADSKRGVAFGPAVEPDDPGKKAGDQPNREARPEKVPQRVHACSRASSRQPMSRRWKPSVKSI